MSREKALKVDLGKWQMVKMPGLSAPSHQGDYFSAEVQAILSRNFGLTFPEVVSLEGEYYYRAIDDKGIDRAAKSKAVKNIADIPKGEILRLMEGWIRSQRCLADEGLPNHVRSILLNLKVPNPRRAIQQYRLYKDDQGQERLMILWGFENKDAPAVSLEKAISSIMDVPVKHLQSILSTSMPTTTSTVAVPLAADTQQIAVMIENAKMQGQAAQNSNSSGWMMLAGCATLVAVLAIAAVAMLMFGDESHSTPVTVYRESPPMPVAAEPTELSVEAEDELAGPAEAVVEAQVVEPSPVGTASVAEVSQPAELDMLVAAAPAEKSAEVAKLEIDLDAMVAVDRTEKVADEISLDDLLVGEGEKEKSSQSESLIDMMTGN